MQKGNISRIPNFSAKTPSRPACSSIPASTASVNASSATSSEQLLDLNPMKRLKTEASAQVRVSPENPAGESSSALGQHLPGTSAGGYSVGAHGVKTGRVNKQTRRRSVKPKVSSNKSLPYGRVGQRPKQTAVSSVRGSLTARPSVTSTTNTSAATAKPKTVFKAPAPWDYKAKVNIMEVKLENVLQENRDLAQKMNSNDQSVATLTKMINEMTKKTEDQTVEIVTKSTVLQELQADLKRKEEELFEMRQRHERELAELVLSTANLKQLITTKDLELQAAKGLNESQRSTIVQLKCQLESAKTDLEAINSLFEAEKRSNFTLGKELQDTIEQGNSIQASLTTKVAELENEIRLNEMERRTLRNTIQELKGNIRVFCRVRPILTEESTHKMIQVSFTADRRTLELTRSDLNESTSKSRSNSKSEFTFDRTFNPSSTQEDIFSELSQLIQSSLDGYNVCVFAYGQTGAGKTFTMEGPAHITDFVLEADNPELGMIPLSVQKIFQTVEDLKSQSWNYKISTSILEIYNETISDLLQANQKEAVKLTNTKSGDTNISNVKVVDVDSAEQVFQLLKTSRKHRKMAQTCHNDYSSRSHLVFRLYIQGENSVTGIKCNGTLNLVDLAGSERLVHDSSFQPNRLQETKNINKSLSNLGNVIKALGENADHIPYRNSKLTHLLMNSLGGNSKTLMLVMVSPLEDNLNETLNSLRFAVSVNQTNIGTATRKIKT